MKIEGNPPTYKRFKTGLWSFDWALGNQKGDVGYPIGAGCEIAGPTGCGKSTFTYGLASLLSKQAKSDIALADFEGFDLDLMETLFSKSPHTLHYIQEKTDEQMLDELISLTKKKANIGILDSIGAISPISEVEGELGEANMGRRAKLLAQFARKYLFNWRASDKTGTLFMVNHLHPNIGAPGLSTPGGVTVGYLSQVRIRVKRKEEFPDGSYVIEGTVHKNRTGYVKRKFYVVVLAGIGIHEGMSAFYDSVVFTSRVKRARTISVDGVSVCSIGKLLKSAYDGDDTLFQPFLKVMSEVGQVEDGEIVEQDDDE